RQSASCASLQPTTTSSYNTCQISFIFSWCKYVSHSFLSHSDNQYNNSLRSFDDCKSSIAIINIFFYCLSRLVNPYISFGDKDNNEMFSCSPFSSGVCSKSICSIV